MSGSAVIVKFDNVNVNVMQANSGIFIGTNTQSGWSSHRKTNGNVSTITGDRTVVSGNVNLIRDDDWIDMAVQGRRAPLTNPAKDG